MKIKILGTKYKIKYRVPSEDTRLEESDGYCDKLQNPSLYTGLLLKLHKMLET
ncbi:MAG: hypothetical protein V8T08_00685 [Monoglobus pectinilyticus]